LNIRRVIVGPEFANQDRGRVTGADVSPKLIPDGGETGEARASVEPALLEERWTVVMRGVDETVRHIQHNRVGLNTLQVAAPPITISVVAIGAFYDDQQVGIGA